MFEYFGRLANKVKDYYSGIKKECRLRRYLAIKELFNNSLISGPFPLRSYELRFLKERIDKIKSEGKRICDSKNSKDITDKL